MLEKGMTVSQAVHRWVQEFNAFPKSMIEKLYFSEADTWNEVTKPTVGCTVYIYELPEEDVNGNKYECSEQEGEIVKISDDGYVIRLSDGTDVLCEDSDDFEFQGDYSLPMWGTLWSFGDSCDDYWLENQNGIEVMSECGFRIYEHDEWGYFFGIDGAGYDFYESHWIPAYKKRGLQWHDKRTEHTEEEVRKMVEAIGICPESIEAIMSIKAGQTVCIDGYYGGRLTDEQANALAKTEHFKVCRRTEMVQEMSHVEKNNYFIVEREV